MLEDLWEWTYTYVRYSYICTCGVVIRMCASTHPCDSVQFSEIGVVVFFSVSTSVDGVVLR